jgi:muramoyltetrapeptide carboxypeptidase LdcA involved in peptidoglycan recycling
MTLDKLKTIIKTKKELDNLPIIANVDFGHTNPMITFPIGGTIKLNLDKEAEIIILKH